MKTEPFNKLLNIINHLKNAKIANRISYYREDAISIEVRVPGQYWEIDIMPDGNIEIEIFQSNGTILSESSLNELIEKFSD